LEIDFDRIYLPEFKVPEGQTSEQYLRTLCEQGLKQKYKQITPDIKQRLDYELSVVNKMGFTEYFFNSMGFYKLC